MNLIIFGPPGSGKGTQADVLCKKLNITHLSTGDIFRNNIKNKTELGQLAKSYIDKGELVPDEVTIKLVESEIQKDQYKKGFLLDGFPRTTNQAKELLKIFNENKIDIKLVINLAIEDAKIIERISNRLTCPSCGEVYHKIFNPPKIEMICDKDQTKLVTRDDDKAEVVENRLKVYYNQTAPVLDYFESNNLNIATINSDDTVDNVNELILGNLK